MTNINPYIYNSPYGMYNAGMPPAMYGRPSPMPVMPPYMGRDYYGGGMPYPPYGSYPPLYQNPPVWNNSNFMAQNIWDVQTFLGYPQGYFSLQRENDYLRGLLRQYQGMNNNGCRMPWTTQFTSNGGQMNTGQMPAQMNNNTQNNMGQNANADLLSSMMMQMSKSGMTGNVGMNTSQNA